MTPPNDSSDPLRKRRRFSAWTLLAPIALLVFVFMAFDAVGESCVFKDCDKQETSSKDEDEKPKKVAPKGTKPTCVNQPSICPPTAMWSVREGDTLSGIAERFELTEEELKACNPKVDPQTLNAGDKLFISPRKCTDADLAEAGANPDPFADDTAVGTAQG